MNTIHGTRDRSGRDAEAGFSLMEVVIGATILFALIGAAGRFIASSTNLLGTVAARNDSDQNASRVADRIARLLRNGSAASLLTYYQGTPIPDGTNQTSLYFREIVSNDGVPVYGKGYYLFPAVDESNYTDNIDNDKDGRIDDVCLRMCTIPAASHVSQTDPTLGAAFGAWYNTSEKLSDIRWVNTLPAYPAPPASAEGGCQFIRTGNVLTIRIVTLKYDPAQRKQINVMSEASVKFRN